MQRIVRRSAEYKPTYQRFVLKKKSYTQQYSHIYVSRLLVLRDAVQRRLAPDQQAPLLPKIIDLRPGSDCIIVGTVLKVLEAKPDLFQSLTNDEKIVSLTTMDVHMATKTDQLILEDESGRVELIGDIDAGLYATGVVMGVRGRMIEGKNGFYVEEVFVPGLPPQPALPERGDSEYVALVSGLSIGRNNDATPLKNHLLMDYLAGRVGNQEEKQFISQIVRTIVVGNSVDSDSAVTQPRNGVIQKKKTTEELTLDAAPMRNLDELLSTLASSMSVDVMPGESDPSNHALPQQSFHSCLFPRSARFASFRAVTNPYEAQVGNVAFLGHSGQPLKSLLQCTLPTDDQMVDEGKEDKGTTEHALDCLERCLQWRHAAPTAPDLLTSFPIANDDPFVIESCPHVFFSGNAAKFGTRSIEGPNGQSVRLVLVPSFNETSTVVLVDLKDLSCFPISIDL
ncbi:hypothetical protein Poli38472_001695 [Pythium oligandrum]|uniref:DNA polymerase delta small subunit n=1 Tax=Pythium oligandrum TaxID=41045 RepID=A0A8K1FQL1_PYTOL|nr:hypothetical protein Poli38472_001695 [Pythium oligandrum]|eukprot:TMW69539.1 hypothetical protein Poli38472_001695 [Pythium oligandrum]